MDSFLGGDFYLMGWLRSMCAHTRAGAHTHTPLVKDIREESYSPFLQR